VFRLSLNRLRDAVRKTPEDPAAWYALGIAVLDAGKLEEGRHALLQSTAVGAPNLERTLAVATRLAAAAFPADAERVARRALEVFPGRADVHAALARLLLGLGDARQAMEVIADALRSGLHSVDLHLSAAEADERMGRLREATHHLGAVLAMDADHMEANTRLATLLARLGDDAGAIRCWRRVVAYTRAEEPGPLTALGIALSRAGQHDEALQLLSGVASQRPDLGSVHGDLGMALLGAGRLDEAVTVLLRALELDPNSAQAYCGLGLAYQRLGRAGDAVEAFRMTEQLAPANGVGPFNLGLALDSLGDGEGARRALLRAAALEPDDQEIRRALQALLVQPGTSDPASALEQFSASISGDLQSFKLLDVLEFLRLQHKTGSLVVSSRDGAGLVRLIRGAVTSASAPGVKRLGEALVERGLIAPSTLEAVLAKQRSADRENAEALGQILLRDRLADRALLGKLVFHQVLQALEEMLAWTEGAFSFHPGEDKELPAIAFDLQRVMLELVRASDERGRRLPPPVPRAPRMTPSTPG
jgi:Flp pilus assembly protein TadD